MGAHRLRHALRIGGGLHAVARTIQRHVRPPVRQDHNGWRQPFARGGNGLFQGGDDPGSQRRATAPR